MVDWFRGSAEGRSRFVGDSQPSSGFWQLAWRRPAVWLLPALVVWLATVAYVIVRPAQWEATQTVSVRPQAASLEGDSRWLDGDQRKSLQETLVELVRSRDVLEATLREVDGKAASPAGGERIAQIPLRQIERLRKAIQITPPQGADLGSSDILCLRIRDEDRGRAIKLVESLCRRADEKWRLLRRERAAAAVAEWEQAVRAAESELRVINGRLAALEKELGTYLPEMRAWATGASNDTPLTRKVLEGNAELRAVETSLADTEGLLREVQSALVDPARLLNAANALIKQEPSIEKWKTAWVESQVKLAEVRSRMTENHPDVVAATAAEREIHDRLSEEVAAFLSILKSECDELRARRELVQSRLATLDSEIRDLAAKRVEYANLVSEREQRLAVLQTARQRRDDARLAAESLASAQLVIPIENAEAGLDPVGPGKAAVLGVGLVAGILFGLGILAWSIPLKTAALPTPQESSGGSAASFVTESRWVAYSSADANPSGAETRPSREDEAARHVQGTPAPSTKEPPSGEPVLHFAAEGETSPDPMAEAQAMSKPSAKEEDVAREAALAGPSVMPLWTEEDGRLPTGTDHHALSFTAALVNAAAGCSSNT